MNPQGTPTGPDDFLSREVGESQTDESIKVETLRALEQAKQIQENFSDNPEIQKEYEEVRLSTIGALKDLRINTADDLTQVRQSLTGDIDFSTLSDGDISEAENQRIQEELVDLKEQEKASVMDIALEHAIEEGLMDRYGAILNELRFTHLESFDIEILQQIQNEILQSGEISGETMVMLRDILINPELIDSAQVNRVKGFLEENIRSESLEIDFSLFTSEAGITSGSIYAAGFHEYVHEHPEDIHYLLFVAKEKISRMCSGEMNIFFEALRFEYIESQNIAVIENLRAFYGNQDIPEDSQLAFNNTLSELEENGTLREFVEELKRGGCTVNYIALIREFNEQHFGELSVEFHFSEQDALNILGSVIKARNDENEFIISDIVEEIHLATGKSIDEIRNILAIENNQVRQRKIETLLGDIENEQQRIRLGETLEDALGVQLEVARQEQLLPEIAENAETIYEMDDAERTEYTRLLMSLTGSSIHIDISREVHRDYVLADPEDRLILIDSADDIISLLPEIDRRDINVDDIKPEFLSHPEILKYFSQSLLREEDFFSLPTEVYYNQELCSILGKNNANHWEVLFYEIMIIHGVSESIAFLHQLIFENPEVFRNEENIETLKNAIPYKIRLRDMEGENMLQAIPVYEPDNTTPDWFNNTVSSYLDYINDPERGVQSGVSPEQGEGNATVQAYTDSLREYIRNFGVSPEIHTSIEALIEAGQINSVRLILAGLNSENENELNLIISAIEEYEVHYNFLSPEAKRHPQVLRKIGESGNFEDLEVEQYIQDEKGLANYLIGYSQSGRDIGNFIHSDEIEVISSNLNNNDLSGNIELTPEESEALNNFRTTMREGGEEVGFLSTLEDIEVEENQIEALKQDIRDYLREYISEEEINVILEHLETRDTDSFWSSLRGYLIAADISEEDRRNILQNTSNLVVRVRREERRIAGEEARDTSLLTPEEIALLDGNPYFEDGEFNEEAILRDFQTFTQENLNIEDISQIGDITFIERYLISLNLPESVLDRKRESFINLIQAQSVLITANFINQLSPEERDRLIPQGIGTYAGQEIGQQILSGEINFSSPEGESSSTQGQGTQSGQTTSGTTGSQAFSHERLSISGENIYYTGPSGEQIPLSPEEAQMIENTPEAEENLVNAYNYFYNIGIPSVWKYRADIIKAMNVMGGDMTIDLTDDSLNPDELLKVAKYIYQITHGREGNASQTRDINFYERELEIYANGGSEIVERRAHNARQHDRFEKDLWKAGVLSTNINGFDTERLREIAHSPEGLSQDSEN